MGLRDEKTAPLVPGAAAGTPRAIGRYQIKDVLGMGGVGVVFLAHDPDLDRDVALKQLRSGGAAGIDWQARLLREAQAMARLNHPNVVTVYDVGLSEDGPFVAMEYVEGTTLRRWLAAQPRRRAEILATFLGAARGLAAAHQAGLVHRDFKPENVLVSHEGRVQVTDFGLVRTHDTEAGARPPALLSAADLEAGSTTMGTPAYMSPEQHRAEPVDARSDQFSFAAALHEALYGERAFAGADVESYTVEVLAGRLRPPPEGKDVPAWLRAVLVRALDPDPRRRYPTMAELVAALEADPAPRRRRRLLWAGGLIALGALLVAYRERTVQREEACRVPVSELSGIWDGARQLEITRAMQTERGPRHARAWERLRGLVDPWVASWRQGREATCLATLRGEQTAELAAKRRACLDERFAELRALSAAMGTPGTDPRLLVALAAELPPNEACADLDVLTAAPPVPADAEKRAAMGRVRALLAEAKVLHGAARYPEAIERARQANLEVAGLGMPELAAQAQVLLAEVTGRVDRARSLVEGRAAMRLAAGTGRNDLLARASAVVGLGLELSTASPELADDWGALSTSFARAHGESRLEAAMSLARGMIAWRGGRSGDAIAPLRRCVDLRAPRQTSEPELLLVCRGYLASALLDAGRRGEALAEVGTTLALLDEHAAVMFAGGIVEHLDRAIGVLVGAHEEERALGVTERALALHDAARAEADPSVTSEGYMRPTLLSRRALVLLQLGRPAEAVPVFEEAVAALGRWPWLQATMQMLLAEAERARGRGEVARALLEKVEYARLPRANRLVFHTISARVFLDARQVEPASAAIEQALAALTPQAAPEDRGELYAARSHLHELRHEVDAARALLVLARSELYRAHHLRAVAAVDARLAGLGHR